MNEVGCGVHSKFEGGGRMPHEGIYDLRYRQTISIDDEVYVLSTM